MNGPRALSRLAYSSTASPTASSNRSIREIKLRHSNIRGIWSVEVVRGMCEDAGKVRLYHSTSIDVTSVSTSRVRISIYDLHTVAPFPHFCLVAYLISNTAVQT